MMRTLPYETTTTRREIELVKTESGLTGWSLRLNDTPRFLLVERTPWRWDLQDYDGTPFESPRLLELEAPLSPNRLLPSAVALAKQLETVAAGSRDWLEDLLPWTPLLIVASTQDDKDAKRRAILALVFAGLVSGDESDFDLRFARFHLHRLAYLAVADLHVLAGHDAVALDTTLRRTLYAWQDEISRTERRGFLREGFPLCFTEPTHPLEGGVRRRCVFAMPAEYEGHEVQEQAMLDLVLNRSGEEAHVRTFLVKTVWGREIVASLIQGWFLPRYDLDWAERLAAALQGDGGVTGWRWQAWLSANALRLGTLLALVYVTFLWALPGSIASTARWVGPVGVAVCSLVYGVMAVQIIYWLCPGTLDITLPRLRAGMLLAVVGTLLQQNWTGLYTFSLNHLWALWVLCGVLTATAWQVLRAKIGSALGADRALEVGDVLYSTATRRCWAIFWRNGSLAFLFSYILVDFLSDSYLLCETGKELVCSMHPNVGLVAGTYPSLVLLFTAILLFAGIFGQLLWDEKPLTEAVA